MDHVTRYRFATFGPGGWILLAVEYNGQIYRGMGPFYNAQPDDHKTSEMEDVMRIDGIVRTTLQQWDGLIMIDKERLTVPLFYDVPGYDRNPLYHSRQGCSFGTLIHLKLGEKISRDIPWHYNKEIIQIQRPGDIKKYKQL